MRASRGKESSLTFTTRTRSVSVLPEQSSRSDHLKSDLNTDADDDTERGRQGWR